MMNFLNDFRRRSANRRALSQLQDLPDHLLNDMGITRDNIREMARTGLMTDPRNR